MRCITPGPVATYTVAMVSSAGLAILLLAAFSREHSALEYLVAGTLITTVALVGTFVVLVRRRKL
jgi:hypothetical protein